MATLYRDNLVSLKDLKDFKVADKEADVRGWRVITSEGLKIGKVSDLIVDRDAMKVRYLDVHLNNDIFDREVDRHVLVPVGLARLHREDQRILLEQMNGSELLALPPYAPGPITADYERSLRSAFSKTQQSDRDEAADFYDHDYYDAESFYGRTTPDELRRH